MHVQDTDGPHIKQFAFCSFMLGTQTLFLAIPLSYHWCLAANLTIGIYNGEESAMVGRILKKFQFDEMVKRISRIARLCARACNFCITILANFGPNMIRFCWALFFIWGHQLVVLGSSSAVCVILCFCNLSACA